MGLNGIDISSWQAGIDIKAVDADFVIVKATGGVGYYNPYFREMADAVLNSGKLLGIYHFAGDSVAGSAEAEAAYFLSAVEPYLGKFIPVLDWEAEATAWPVAWAKTWLDIVAEATKATPWFYSYLSYVQSHQAELGAICKYPLWLAAYYNGYQAMNYTENPPLYGSTLPWNEMTCYQYSSTGWVSGYGARLDINRFYGTREDWLAMCGEEDNMTPEEVAQAVWGYNYKGTARGGNNVYDQACATYDLVKLVEKAAKSAEAAAKAAETAAKAAKTAAQSAEAAAKKGVSVDTAQIKKDVANEIAARMKE